MTSAMLDAAAALRAQLAQYTHDTRLLRFMTSAGADQLLVEHIDGHEGLSQGYRFDITALSSDAGLDLDSLLGQPALLQILTQHSRADLQPIHGHITTCERLGSDGGFTRYRFVLEPWTAFLRYRFDSWVWQDATIIEILEDLFSDYRDQGKLVPSWRFALADASQYPRHEVRTQFDESDWSFIERLLADEGLFYWFEHHADSDDAASGTHQLVIGDHNGAFTPNVQQTIRFHRAAAVEQADSITGWHASRHVMTNAIVTGSWHEGQVGNIAAQADSAHDNGATPQLTVIDQPGARSFATRTQAERATRRQLEALEARNKLYHGESSVRTLAPATTFVLTDHAIHDADRSTDDDSAATFAVIAVRHRARNNLSSAVRTLIHGMFANIPHAGEEDRGDAPLYQNHFTALRADIPWRPLSADGRGALLHPKPTVTGVQTALVVGNPGEDLTTERDHRIKVQMHWQRGRNSGNRRAHPAGADNAPGDAQAYVWVRVAEAAAGPNWGSSFTPRIGQEVLLDYLEGDIDRPIVIGSLYNGRGMEDAQGNQIAHGAAVATGNAPAWFAGGSGEHAHNAVLSGFKTQEIGNSQDGQGGHNALILDDSTGEVGARLQTTRHTTQLNLGHIKRQQDNARQQSHGHGAELTTDAFGAIRSGQGLLISADARPDGTASQMDAREAHDQLRNAHALQSTLADTAQKHNAFTGDTFDKTQHSQPETTLNGAIDSLAHTEAGTGNAAGGGTVPAFGRPDLIVSAPAGVALLTPADLHASATAISITGGIDVSATMGRNLAVAVRSGISLFTYGDAKASRKAQGDKGIKLHAANGKVDLQAQSGQLQAAAERDVQIDSTQANVQATAKDHVLLTAGGAYVKIAGGNIEIHAPGSVQFKAGMKELSGAARGLHEAPHLPKPAFLPTQEELQGYSAQFVLMSEKGRPMANYPYIMESDHSHFIEGVTDKEGKTQRIYSKEKIVFTVRKNEKENNIDKFTPPRTERFYAD
jgi:type VI secretion system secreted protein VgrG